ncbi:MAG: hypothetical protein LC790_17285 [Actinobacteria bacterium]|nr:hypothetical protein [Actinomycetota bacterium]
MSEHNGPAVLAEGLVKHYTGRDGTVEAVRGVDLEIRASARRPRPDGPATPTTSTDHGHAVVLLAVVVVPELPRPTSWLDRGRLGLASRLAIPAGGALLAACVASGCRRAAVPLLVFVRP